MNSDFLHAIVDYKENNARFRVNENITKIIRNKPVIPLSRTTYLLYALLQVTDVHLFSSTRVYGI